MRDVANGDTAQGRAAALRAVNLYRAEVFGTGGQLPVPGTGLAADHGNLAMDATFLVADLARLMDAAGFNAVARLRAVADSIEAQQAAR